MTSVTITANDNIDSILSAYHGVDQLAIRLSGGGRILTKGTREWNELPDSGFKFGRNWTLDIDPDTTLVWDVDKVMDSEISEEPIHLICSREAAYPEDKATPEEVWGLLPRGQKVRGGTIDLQFDKAKARWNAQNKKLRIGAVLLSGHEAAIEKMAVTNFGALGAEGFPLVITGGIGQYARNMIAQLDTDKYVLDGDVPDVDCAHITDCPASGYDTSTNDQVTVRMIVGNMGERSPGEWIQTMRAYAYQSGNDTQASGKWVQAHTIYQVLRGTINFNRSNGAAVGVYGDFFATKRLNVDLNSFLGCDYAGIRFLLSPRGDWSDQFSHEDYNIGINQITSKSGVQVDLNTFGRTGSKRYIRNIAVDSSLLLDNQGAENVTRPSAIPAKRKGCL